MNLKLAVFDLDGTLVDSARDLAAGINYMRDSFALPPLDITQVRSFIGDGIHMLVKRATAGTDVDQQEAVARMKYYYSEHLTDFTRLYPGVQETMMQLQKSGIVLAVVTNKGKRESEEILQKLHAREYFSDIIGGDSGYPLKPEPDALIALKEKYALPAASCWMIGDHCTDLESGRRAGFKRIWCQYGIGELRHESAEFQIAEFQEVLKFFDLQ